MSSVIEVPSPVCEHCEIEMTFVGKLPSVLHYPAVRVFRCFSCNHVASEEARELAAV
jgi:hypothetical protein